MGKDYDPYSSTMSILSNRFATALSVRKGHIRCKFRMLRLAQLRLLMQQSLCHFEALCLKVKEGKGRKCNLQSRGQKSQKPKSQDASC